MKNHLLILNGIVIMSEEFEDHINNSNHTAFLSRTLVKKFDLEYDDEEFVRSSTRFFSSSIKLFGEVKPMETKVGDNVLTYKVEDV